MTFKTKGYLSDTFSEAQASQGQRSIFTLETFVQKQSRPTTPPNSLLQHLTQPLLTDLCSIEIAGVWTWKENNSKHTDRLDMGNTLAGANGSCCKMIQLEEEEKTISILSAARRLYSPSPVVVRRWRQVHRSIRRALYVGFGQGNEWHINTITQQSELNLIIKDMQMCSVYKKQVKALLKWCTAEKRCEQQNQPSQNTQWNNI